MLCFPLSNYHIFISSHSSWVFFPNFFSRKKTVYIFFFLFVCFFFPFPFLISSFHLVYILSNFSTSLSSLLLYPSLFSSITFLFFLCSFALIDGVWLDSWLDFVSDPTVEKPGILDNFRLRCDHGAVLLPPYLVDISIDSSPVELKKTLGCEESSRCGFPDSEIITYPQWQALLKIYGIKPTVVVSDPISIKSILNMSECDRTTSNNPYDMEISEDNDIDFSATSTVVNTVASKISTEIEIEESDTNNSKVFEVTLRASRISKSYSLEGVDCGGVSVDCHPRADRWCWAPSLCVVCRQEREDRVNNLHLNFHHHSFEVIIVPYEPLEEDRDMDKYAEYTDARPYDLTAGSPTYTVPNPALSRRNPTRRGAGRRGTKTVRVDLSSDDLISFVKAKLAERVEDSVLSGLGGHVLMCSGQRLTDHSKTLREYNVKRDETLSLLLSNSNEGLSGLFFQTKADSLYENGFGKNSFLSGGSTATNTNTNTGSASSVINVTSISDFEPSKGDIVNVREVTGCSVEDAVRELLKSRGDVNAACESILSL